MRCGLLIGVLAGFCGGTVPSFAQTYPAEVTVTAVKVEVRSGPSDKLYQTAELKRGDRIVCFVPESSRFSFAILHLTVV